MAVIIIGLCEKALFVEGIQLLNQLESVIFKNEYLVIGVSEWEFLSLERWSCSYFLPCYWGPLLLTWINFNLSMDK